MMRKAGLTAIVIAAAAGVATSFLLFQKPGGATAIPAARLLPADTLFLAEAPDLNASATRWKETGVARLLAEPEVAAFLERPRSAIPKNAKWTALTARLSEADIRHAFLAVTRLEGNMPHVAAGAAYHGPKAALDALMAEARKAAEEAAPGAKRDLSRHGEFEVESFSDGKVTVAWAFADGWLFAANQVDLLKATLDRFTANKEEGTLAAAENFRKSFEPLGDEAELRLFAQPGGLIEQIIGLSALSGQPLNPKQTEELRKFRSFASTIRFDGTKIHDAAFVYVPGAQKVPTLTGSTLGLTTPSTLLYYAASLNLPDQLDLPETLSDVPDTTGFLSKFSALRDTLKGNPKEIFGEEFGLSFDWSAITPYPLLRMAVEIRDQAKTRELVTILLSDASPQVSEKEGTSYWSVALGQGTPFTLTGALNSTHLIAGLDAAAVEATANGTLSKEGTLADNPAFKKALSPLSKPEVTLFYFDLKTAFERAYTPLRPMAPLWINFIPNATQFVDVTKLPEVETIARHLEPTVIVSRQVDDGFFMESTGTLSAYQGFILGGGAIGAVAGPLLQGKLPLPGLGNGSGTRPAPRGLWQQPAATPPAATPEPETSTEP